MDWDLPQLRALAAAIDGGSLEAAARTLHVTPSAVSQRLKALESQVGAVLLTRTRPVRPTPAGEAVVRLARQIDALTGEFAARSGRTGDGQEDDDGPGEPALRVVRLAINADSLATWALPALAPLAGRVALQILRADQNDTAALLRDGSVMAAVTSEATPVQGCTVETLGTMRYLPMAAPAVLARCFDPADPTGSLARMPVVVFDEQDLLQDEVVAAHGVDPRRPPRHYVPASTQFADAVRLGFGWALVPELQLADWPAGTVARVPGLPHVDVVLRWQQWSLRTPSLDEVADAVRAGGREQLRGAPAVGG